MSTGFDDRGALALVGRAANARSRVEFLGHVLSGLRRMFGTGDVRYLVSNEARRPGDIVLAPTGERVRVGCEPTHAARTIAALQPALAGLWQHLSRAEGLRRAVRSAAPATSWLVSFTDAERRVIDLVVLGLDNRSVAELLAVSDKAVEQHLTRVYRKLGVHSRAQLIVHLAGAA